MEALRNSLVFLDTQVIAYTVLALVPNLLLILWAMARLSREVRLLKSKMAMVENDINLLEPEHQHPNQRVSGHTQGRNQSESRLVLVRE